MRFESEKHCLSSRCTGQMDFSKDKCFTMSTTAYLCSHIHECRLRIYLFTKQSRSTISAVARISCIENKSHGDKPNWRAPALKCKSLPRRNLKRPIGPR